MNDFARNIHAQRVKHGALGPIHQLSEKDDVFRVCCIVLGRPGVKRDAYQYYLIQTYSHVNAALDSSHKILLVHRRGPHKGFL